MRSEEKLYFELKVQWGDTLEKRELHGFGVNSPTPFVSYQGSFNRSKSAVKWLFWD